jgi:hypothetical protein
MQGRHKQLLERYERVQEFLRGHPPAAPSAAFVAKSAELGALVDRLRALFADQVIGRRASMDDVQRTALARRHLRDRHLRPISQIARGALSLNDTALRSLALPSVKLPNFKLLVASASVREAAAKHAQTLVENGRPEDFLARLDAAMERLSDAMNARASSVGLHVGARAGVVAELKRGRKLMEVLDTLVADAWEGNAEVLARWRTARRVKLLPGGARRAEDQELQSAA